MVIAECASLLESNLNNCCSIVYPRRRNTCLSSEWPKQTQVLRFCARAYLPEVILGQSVRNSLALGMSSWTRVLVHVRKFYFIWLVSARTWRTTAGGMINPYNWDLQRVGSQVPTISVSHKNMAVTLPRVWPISSPIHNPYVSYHIYFSRWNKPESEV